MEPFEQVVQDHGAVVWRVCRALLPAADADDAWSDAFLAALRAYPDLRPDSNVRGWLVTIAHRKALDVLRRQARAPVPTADLADLADLTGFTGLTGLVDRAQLGGRSGGADPRWGDPAAALPDEVLWGRVARLPEAQRDAVLYHHVAGLAHAEVAELVGCSPAAARRRAADGIARLRRDLSGARRTRTRDAEPSLRTHQPRQRP